MKSLHIALATAALLITSAVQAQTVTVTPTNSTIIIGESVSLDFNATGFTDATFGGGFNLSYDKSILELVSMSIPSRWEFFRSTGLLDAASGTVSDVNFNTFTPIGGDFLTATAVFKGVGEGTSAVTLTPSELFPFAGADGRIPVNFAAGSVTVTAVPEPSSVALLAAGLACTLLMARRRKA
jgi:hypothetical protein